MINNTLNTWKKDRRNSHCRHLLSQKTHQSYENNLFFFFLKSTPGRERTGSGLRGLSFKGWAFLNGSKWEKKSQMERVKSTEISPNTQKDKQPIGTSIIFSPTKMQTAWNRPYIFSYHLHWFVMTDGYVDRQKRERVIQTMLSLEIYFTPENQSTFFKI